MLYKCPHCGLLIPVNDPAVKSVTCISCKTTFSLGNESALTGSVTLTDEQLKMPQIQEFLDLLVKISADGVLEYEELQELTQWLNKHIHTDVAAVKLLVDLMLKVCKDGKITPEEIFEIQLGIDRVLPKEYRTRITEARKAASYAQPASRAQLDLIQAMLHQRPSGLNRREAAEMIDQLLKNLPASNPRLMH